MELATLCALPVGVVPWRQPKPAVTVVVKATFSLDQDGEAPLARVQEPLGLDDPGAETTGPALWAASDFAPRKARTDVLVVGHVHARAPCPVLPGRFVVDELERRFVAVASQPCSSLPLSPRYLRAADAVEGPPLALGPRPSPSDPWSGHPADHPFDFSAFNVAPSAQQLDRIEPTARLLLENLLPNVALRACRLPGLQPVCFHVATGRPQPGRDTQSVVPQRVALRCDTLWIDTDRRLCTLCWRGLLVLGAEPATSNHLVVTTSAGGVTRHWSEIAGELPHARWVRAVEPTVPRVPPTWVRPTSAAHAMKGLLLPRATAPPARPSRPAAHTTYLPDLVPGPLDPLPFASRSGRPPPTSRPQAEPTLPPAGSTAVIERDVLLRSRALPFEEASVGSILDARARTAPSAGPTGPRSSVGASVTPSHPARLERPALVPAAASPSATMPRGSKPPAAGQLTSPVVASDRDGVALEAYARIKTELWRSPNATTAILERHGIDEARWRSQEQQQERALAEQARQGQSELAARLQRALTEAQSELGALSEPTLTVDEYVAIRVQVDAAEEPAAVLATRGLSAEQWQRLRRSWHARSLGDPTLARELRTKLAAARRSRRAANL